MTMKIKSSIAISGSGFIFNPDTGESFTVNPLGRSILEYLREGKSIEEISIVILEKYNVGDKSLYWKSNKNTSTQIRESLSNAVETVNIMNFGKVKTSDKSINIDLKNPFFAGKFRLNFTDIIDPDIVSINTVNPKTSQAKIALSENIPCNHKPKSPLLPPVTSSH